MEDMVRSKLGKKTALGRIAGPHVQLPLPKLSPLGIVPKEMQGEFRLIHHQSYPHGDSVNDSIDPQLCFLKYASSVVTKMI